MTQCLTNVLHTAGIPIHDTDPGLQDVQSEILGPYIVSLHGPILLTKAQNCCGTSHADADSQLSCYTNRNRWL